MKCECCGKNGQTKEENFCYGCHHIVCIECTFDRGCIIMGKHTLGTHKKARNLMERSRKLDEYRKEILGSGKIDIVEWMDEKDRREILDSGKEMEKQ